MGIHYTRPVRLRHLREHLVDAMLGFTIGFPLAVVAWLATLWIAVR